MEVKQDSSVKKEVDTSDKTPRMVGFIIIFLIFGVFGTWSVLAPLESAALAQGSVTVKGSRKTIQHLEGGIVREFFVKDGDRVDAGAPLLLLDDTQARAELQIIKSQSYVVAAQEARLIAERDDYEKIAFPESLNVDDPRAIEAKKLESQQFNVRKVARDGEIEVFQQRVEQFKSQIKGLQALRLSKKALIKSYNEEINDNQALLSQGFVDKKRLRDLQRLKEGLVGELAELLAQVAAVTVQVGEAELQILQLKKNFRTEVVGQLTEVQARLYDLNERLTAIQHTVERSLIKAPVNGVVLGLSVHTIGGVIAAGTPILDMVPDKNELVIEARVSPVDIDRVYEGLTADIRFSTFKSTVIPVVEGKVITLSPDSLIDEQGIPYYLARIELLEGQEKILGGNQLLPGMPAEVLINTGSRTLFEYLAQPATNAFARSLIED
ncbi:MAG: HlyD family type I secretion periplasmic adaptor subunit [Neptuniibacter sp.]